MINRYEVTRMGPEWWVMDTTPYLPPGMEVVNKYTKDAEDRANEVAADMNRHDKMKRGLSDETKAG